MRLVYPARGHRVLGCAFNGEVGVIGLWAVDIYFWGAP